MIRQQIREYVKENFLMGLSDARFDDNASFLGLGILDSTGVIELISFIEERFGVQVADEEMVPENLDSVNAIERYVRGKTALDDQPPVLSAAS